jgi:hypothetical protein
VIATAAPQRCARAAASAQASAATLFDGAQTPRTAILSTGFHRRYDMKQTAHFHNVARPRG